jgi:hypothetical protein
MTTDGERFPKLEIPVVLSIEGEFIREPRSIVQILRSGAAVTPCQVTLRHGKGLPWRVDSVVVEGLDAREIKIGRYDPGEAPEKTIVVTGVPPVKPSFSVKNGSLLVKAVVREKTEIVRIPILFVWKD